MERGVKSCCYIVAIAFVLIVSSPSCDCQGQALIVGGSSTSIEHFPYHVGIYRSHASSGVYQQICGGTLISTTHVISAAHCFYNERTKAANVTSIYRVAAGKTYRSWRSALDSDSVQRRRVSKLTLPKWYIGSANSLANDIALVTLEKAVKLTSSVGLAEVDWNGVWTREQLAPGSSGTAVGWGISESGNPSEGLKSVSLPYIDPDTCFDSLDETLQKFLTFDKFCAGFLNTNTSVCPGDSGGGLVFYHAGTDTNFLRGIVSLAFKPAGNDDKCFARHYAAFTMVTPRVVRKLREDGGLRGGSSTPSCGKATPRTAGGDTTGLQFPWHVAVYEKTGPKAGDFSYVCGGSLIAATFFITAAHCFHDDEYSTAKDPSTFRVSAGGTKMVFEEPGNLPTPTLQTFGVARVSIHEDYTGSSGNFANNVAVVRLDRPALLTATVAPVCVDWEEEYDADLSGGAVGVVSGITVIPTGDQTDSLKWAKVPYVGRETCATFARTQNSERLVFAPNFCIGSLRKSRDSCRNDAGTGFSVLRSKRGYFLRGVVVVSLGHSSYRTQCYSEGYTLTQAIGPFTGWIRNVVVAAEPDDEGI